MFKTIIIKSPSASPPFPKIFTRPVGFVGVSKLLLRKSEMGTARSCCIIT